MTVGELKEWLKDYDESKEVVLRPSNGFYVDSVAFVKEETVKPFWGDNYEVVLIRGEQQVGALL